MTRELAKALKSAPGTETAAKTFDERRRAEDAKKIAEPPKPTARELADQVLAALIARLHSSDEKIGERVFVTMVNRDCGVSVWNDPTPDHLYGYARMVFEDLAAAAAESNWHPYVESCCISDHDHRLQIYIQYGEKHWSIARWEERRFDGMTS